MPVNHMLRCLVLSSIHCCLLVGCADDRQPSDQEVLRAETLRPADPQLSAKYERSCIVCHGVRGGAPLAGFAPAWRSRLSKGHDVLLSHARDGFNGMPAKGMCNDCSSADLNQLINFMSQQQ